MLPLHTAASPTRVLALLAAVLACAPAAALQPAAPADAAARLASAELLLNGGDCRAGAEAYARAAAGSRDPRIARRATDVGLACAHLPAAWQSAQRWAAIDPENVDALRAAGLVALELWRIDDARRLFGALLAKPDVEADRALGDLLPLVTDGEHAPAAWLAFDRVVDRATASPDTLVALARLAAAADDLGAASRLLESARSRGGAATAAGARLAAAIAVAAGDDTRALDAAREAARLDPAEQSFALAETLVELDRTEEAFRETERLAQLPELRSEAERRLALLALASGDLADAQRRFGARLQRGTGTAEAVFYLGLIAERRGDLDLALQSYRRLVEAGAGLLPRTRAAALLIRRGDPAAGLALLDEHARAERDDLVEVESTKAQLLSEAGQHDAALAGLDAALRRHPAHPGLLYQRAMILEGAGRTREALRAFEALLRERPDDSSVLNALGYTLADRNRDLARAERLIRRALQQRPDNAAFVDSLGWVRFRRGDAAGALPFLERAWRLSREAEIAAHWGEVLWVIGDKAQARVVWARALARAPDSRPLRAVLERFTGAEPSGAAPR
jgi:tetratricopeptide (TPR) repeat protein